MNIRLQRLIKLLLIFLIFLTGLTGGYLFHKKSSSKVLGEKTQIPVGALTSWFSDALDLDEFLYLIGLIT